MCPAYNYILREMKIMNFLIEEVIFENYKFHHFEKIEFPYRRDDFLKIIKVCSIQHYFLWR